jgi:hypothetical protein
LESLTKQCHTAGYTPNFGELLTAIARQNPGRAFELVGELLKPGATFKLSGAWQQFLYGMADKDQLLPLLREAGAHSRSEVRRGVVDYFRFRDRQEMVFRDEEKVLLEQIAAKAQAGEIMAFVQLVQWVGPTCADWGFRLLGTLPLASLGTEANGEVLAALNPYHANEVVPPLATVQHVLDSLVRVPEIKVDHHGGGWERIVKLYPRAVYDFVLKRAALYEELGHKSRFQVLPHAVLARFELGGLSAEPDFTDICAFLWEKATTTLQGHMGFVWRELFQGIVLEHDDFWLPRLTAALDAVTSWDALRNTLEIIHFDGSLVIFRYPDLTTAVLAKATDLDGTKGYERMRAALHAITGPSGRTFANGELAAESDYVEAEAIKAAEVHAKDPGLGPFFRWMVEIERHERAQNRRRYQADMTAMDKT